MRWRVTIKMLKVGKAVVIDGMTADRHEVWGCSRWYFLRHGRLVQSRICATVQGSRDNSSTYKGISLLGV